MGSAYAQPTATLSSESVEVGEQVDVELEFINNGEVTLIDGAIMFGSSNVSIDGMGSINVNGPALDDTGFNAQINQTSPGVINILVSNLGDPDALIPSGTIALIPFNGLNSGLGFDNTPLTWDADSFFGDEDEMDVLGDFTNGSISIFGGTGGTISVDITKSSDTTRVEPGIPTLITYQIILNSNGSNTATGVNVVDELPNGAIFEDGMSSSECALGQNNTVECSVGSIPSGQEVELNIAISIVAMEGDILNQAIVEFLGEIGEPVENTSNTFTIRVGGDAGGGGCVLASINNTEMSELLGLLAPFVLLPLVMVLRRRKRG